MLPCNDQDNEGPSVPLSVPEDSTQVLSDFSSLFDIGPNEEVWFPESYRVSDDAQTVSSAYLSVHMVSY